MDEKQITTEPVKKVRSRWFRLTPDRFVIGLLLVVCLLWLSDRFQWFGSNHHKGWPVLIAVAAIGMAAIVMLLWWIAGLIFGWRFQFGIRSLLLFCLACSIAVSWLAVERRLARRQAEVVESINSVGAAVYDWQFDADGRSTGNSEPAAGWLRKMLGVDFFSTVAAVGYGGGKITDTGLEHLEELTQLQVLNLDYTTITDAGLQHLNRLTELRALYLTKTDVTDAGVKKLQQALPNCQIYR